MLCGLTSFGINHARRSISNRSNLVLTFNKNGSNVDDLYVKIFDLTIMVYDLKQFANISTYGLQLNTILAIEYRLDVCQRCRKGVKFTSGLTRHVNTYKTFISLLCCQLSNPDLVLDYNTTNFLDSMPDNNEENITCEVSNYSDSEKTRPVNISNNKEDIRSANIDK